MTLILKVSSIKQKFGGLVALNDINLEIHEGEIIGIIGPNGAGKTTLFNVITGYYKPTYGTVTLLGEDVTGKTPHYIASLGFGRTFQNIRLFSKMTSLENVMMARTIRTKSNFIDIIFQTKKNKKEEAHTKEYAEYLLNILNIYNLRYTLASNLPYGSQRKLEIARALAIEPKLLLLDEPAAGMNEKETDELMEITKKLSDLGYTILLIEHDMKFVMNTCKKISVLNYGQQIAFGTPSEIRSNPDVIEAYLGKEEE